LIILQQWEKFETTLKANYPEEAALNSKKSMSFMKKLLEVEDGSNVS